MRLLTLTPLISLLALEVYAQSSSSLPTDTTLLVTARGSVPTITPTTAASSSASAASTSTDSSSETTTMGRSSSNGGILGTATTPVTSSLTSVSGNNAAMVTVVPGAVGAMLVLGGVLGMA